MAEWHGVDGVSALSNAVAERVAIELGAAIERQGRASFAISGGSAMQPLAAIRAKLGEHWKSVFLTWADERCVDFEHEDSSRGQAYRQGHLDEKDRPGTEHPLWRNGDLPQFALDRSSEFFAKNYPDGLDIVLLGMGPDGHIASIFPGKEVGGEYVAHVVDSPKPPPERITLSPSFLAKTRLAILYAAGDSKRDALGRLRRGDPALCAASLPSLAVYTDQSLDEL